MIKIYLDYEEYEKLEAAVPNVYRFADAKLMEEGVVHLLFHPYASVAFVQREQKK